MSTDQPKKAARPIAVRKWISGELGSSFPTLDELTEKIDAEYAADQYNKLTPYKALVLLAEAACPLEMSYDVSRVHHPYFLEFTWTTMLGGIYISPQSGWLTALLSRQAAQDASAVEYRPPVADKYDLADPAGTFAHVVFIPGSNSFRGTISIEALTAVMRDQPDAVIKPHPMTAPGTIRELGREFGYHRILNPKASGATLLKACEVAYVSPTTELGLHGHLLGKRIVSVGNPLKEARAAYGPLYAILREDPAALPRILGSDKGGFFRADEPDLSGRLERYFANAMATREVFNPPVREIGPTEYADFMSGQFRHVGAA